MENPTPGVTGADKSPDQIEREMADTRDSITDKVSMLETQVMGTVQSVTGTVEAVKGAITAAPTAVSDTVKQTAQAVKDAVRDAVDSVKESVRNFSVSRTVRNNPWAAVGTSSAVGFLTGLLLFGGSGGRRRPLMARGGDEPAPGGRPGVSGGSYAAPAYAADAESGGGMFGGLFGVVGKHVREVAEQALSTAMSTLKKSVGTVVPQVVDNAVQQVAGQVGGGPGDGTTRVNGPSYSARG